jgi:RNA polymerase sigma factor (sigma-70 family)
MIPHQDQQYIEALLNNDAVLLNKLYEKYSSKIRDMVLKNNGNAADAADIFQEALLDIYQRAKHKNFILTCPLDAYLYLICKNRWINKLNKQANSGVTFTDTAGYNYTDNVFENAAILQNQYNRNILLTQKFKELGDGCRELLELSWTGISMMEVAEKLQNSYSYIKKKKSECMAKLISMVKSSPQFVTLQW